MTDKSKINIKNDFAKPGLAKSDTTAKPAGASAKVNSKSNADSDIYKGSTKSQEFLKLENKNKPNLKNTKSELIPPKASPELEIKAKNPILYEQLKKTNAKLDSNPKAKQAPPDPSLRVKLSPKGYAINPRKVKPQIPGRLNPFFDNGKSALDRLAMSLGEQSGIDLNNLYADNILKDYMLNYQSSSIAELLNLEYTIFNQDTEFIIDFLSARAELLAEDQFLYDFLQNVLKILQQSHNPIQQILQLYLPFPLPFVVKDLDFEFAADEKELYEDTDAHDEAGKDSDSEDDDNDDSKDVEEEVNEVSISVSTLNFNKMHFLIRFLKSSNEAKIFIKGDTTSSELSIPVEMSIDDALYGQVDHLDFQNSLWRKALPLKNKERYLKIKHKGKLDSRMILVTRTILETIADNDYNEEQGSEIL